MTSERRWKRPVTLTSFPSLFVSLRVSSPPPSRLSPSVSDSLCSSSPTAEPVGGDQRETETGGDRKARVHGKQRNPKGMREYDERRPEGRGYEPRERSVTRGMTRSEGRDEKPTRLTAERAAVSRLLFAPVPAVHPAPRRFVTPVPFAPSVVGACLRR